MDPVQLPSIREGLLYLVALILSICVHEFGHAWVDDKLGDPLPRSQGRVTLNPLAHADLIGTIILPLVAFLSAISSPQIGMRILGWGKPVQISLSARSMTRKISIRTSHALIAIAGPMMNVLFGLVLSGLYFLLLRAGRGSLAEVIAGIVTMNISLCFFNLLPVPPLDGGAVFGRLLPRSAAPLLDLLNRWGFMILFLLLMTPYRGGTLLTWAMWPAHWISVQWLTTLYLWAA